MPNAILAPQGDSVVPGRGHPLCLDTLGCAGGTGFAGFVPASNGMSLNGNGVAGQLKIFTLLQSLVRDICTAIDTAQ